MFKFNITSFVLLTALIISMVFLVQECNDKKHYKQVAKKQLADFAIYESEIIDKYKQEKKVLRDTIIYYKKILHSNDKKISDSRHEIKRLKDELGLIEEKVTSLPPNESYAFLRMLYGATDTLKYPFAGNQVQKFHANYLEGIRCKELTKELEVNNDLLSLSLRTSGEMAYDLNGQLDACEEVMDTLSVKVAEQYLEKQQLKKKINRNRVLVGLVSVVAVIALL